MNNEHISKRSSTSSSLKGRGKAAVSCRYLRVVRIWAENSYCERHQVGALVVKDKTIISDGYSGAPSGLENICEGESGVTKSYVLHAEANAITKPTRSGNNSEDSALYMTTPPYTECAKLIIQAGIRRVVYVERYRLTNSIDLLTRAGVEIEYISLEDGSDSSSVSL